MAAGDGQVWIVDDHGRLVRIDPHSGRRLSKTPVPAGWITALAVGGGAVWLTDHDAGTVWRFDTATGIARTFDVGQGVDSVAFGAGAAWAANSLHGTVTRLDAGGVTATIDVGGTPRALAAGAGRVWVAISDLAGASPAAGGLRAGARVTALSAPPCGPVITGHDGDPDLLIATDLPLRGQQHVTQPMAAAVAFVARRHGFRAGRFTVGVQACDEATTQYGSWDPAKCKANARAYVANRRSSA